MKKQLGIATCILSLLCSQAAWAEGITGELHLIKGKVLVSKGKGYRLAGSARTGQRIKLGKNSSAVLTLPNGCDVQLSSRQVYVVPAVSPCTVAVQSPPQPVVQAPPPPVAYVPPVEPLIDTPWLIGGGVAAAAALGAGGYFLFLRCNGVSNC